MGRGQCPWVPPLLGVGGGGAQKQTTAAAAADCTAIVSMVGANTALRMDLTCYTSSKENTMEKRETFPIARLDATGSEIHGALIARP